MQYKKKQTAWNKGLKGFRHEGSFKKGRMVSKEIRKAISEGNSGKIRTEDYKINRRGIRNSPSTEFKKGERISIKTEFKKGNAPWNKGVKNFHSKEGLKKISDANKKRIGELAGNWQGGLSFEPYDKNFNKKFKIAVRKRDNQICMLCGIHREKLNRAFDVHHIDYNKLMSVPQNCISLCKVCHVKTNFNRKSWVTFFQSLLSDKYDYNYIENDIVISMKGGSICTGV